MNYAELQTAVADYLHRTDLTAQMPGFVALAEAAMFRELNLREIETSATGTATGGVIPLPADFQTLGRLTVTYSGRECSLDYGKGSTYASTGMPTGYTAEDGVLKVHPASDWAYTMHYTPKITPLATSGTNWLLTNAPDLYLYATALEASKWARDDQQVTLLSAQLFPLLDSVRNLSARRGLSRSGPMQIKVRR